MQSVETSVEKYLKACRYQKRLDEKTIKAYRIDLNQFCEFLESIDGRLDKNAIIDYLESLNQRYKPSSAKRKLASAKAFVRYLVEAGVLSEDPFLALRIHIQEPKLLPRTIPLRVINAMLQVAYLHVEDSENYKSAVRDAAVMELLFATGIRVSELSRLNTSSIDLQDGTVMIFGKGARERVLQIGNAQVLSILNKYSELYHTGEDEPFFKNRLGRRLSEQSVRIILRRYAKKVTPLMHITPHMFRHSFATLLLEEDVDIRYIQGMLGHSSISTTEIYTYVATAKQRRILSEKHPRNRLKLL